MSSESVPSASAPVATSSTTTHSSDATPADSSIPNESHSHSTISDSISISVTPSAALPPLPHHHPNHAHALAESVSANALIPARSRSSSPASRLPSGTLAPGGQALSVPALIQHPITPRESPRRPVHHATPPRRQHHEVDHKTDRESHGGSASDEQAAVPVVAVSEVSQVAEATSTCEPEPSHASSSESVEVVDTGKHESVGPAIVEVPVIVAEAAVAAEAAEVASSPAPISPISVDVDQPTLPMLSMLSPSSVPSNIIPASSLPWVPFAPVIVDGTSARRPSLTSATPGPGGKAVSRVLPSAPELAAAYQARTALELLHHGAVFRKHGRWGSPHLRRVWLSWDCTRIHWAELDRPAKSDTTLRLSDVTSISAGARTSVFKGSLSNAELASPAVQSACFSIVTSSRTLDLQVAQLTSAARWVSALRLLLTVPPDFNLRAFADLALLDPKRENPLAVEDECHEVWLQPVDIETCDSLVRKFEGSPADCVAFMIQHNLIGDSPDAIGACLYHLTHRGLDGNKLGEYLSKESRLPIVEAFMRCVDFRGLSMVEALRRLFSRFKPAGEGQVISRILDSFAECYFSALKLDAAEAAALSASTSALKKSPLALFTWFSNPSPSPSSGKTQSSSRPDAPPAFNRAPSSPVVASSLPFTCADTICVLAFSTLMLNTSLHNPTARENMSMSEQQFITMNRGIDGGRDVDVRVLRDIYAAVSEEQIKLNTDANEGNQAALFLNPIATGWLLLPLGTDSGDDESAKCERYWAIATAHSLHLFGDNSDAPVFVLPLAAVRARPCTAPSAVDLAAARESRWYRRAPEYYTDASAMDGPLALATDPAVGSRTPAKVNSSMTGPAPTVVAAVSLTAASCLFELYSPTGDALVMLEMKANRVQGGQSKKGARPVPGGRFAGAVDRTMRTLQIRAATSIDRMRWVETINKPEMPESAAHAKPYSIE